MINFSIFLVLITIVSFLLVVVIMVQNPKNGGLSSTFGGSQVGGVQNTNDFLTKSTWTLGIILIVLILLSSLSFTHSAQGDDLIDESDVPAATAPAPATPAAGTQGTATPAGQPQGATAAPATATPAPAKPASGQ